MLDDLTDIQRILVVMAHPDDVDFSCAGAVAAWTAGGIHVAYCLVTDGDAGGAETGIPRAEMAAVRHAEQTAAAAVVGVTELHWLGYPDGAVVASLDLRRDLCRVIREVRPDRVVCQSPDRLLTRIFASHPDHLAAGEATLCAVYPDSRNAWAFPELLAEGFEPHVVREVYLVARERPDRFVDVTSTIDSKIAALQCHRSQLPDPEAMGPMLKAWAADLAQRAGLPDGSSAEGFERVATA